MMNQVLEKGDIIAMKDGREVEVMSVKYDGPELRRFDFIDRKEVSPFRRTEYPSAILRIIRKNPKPVIDPKSVRPYDNPVPAPIPVTVVNQDANKEVHPAVKQPAKPIMTRSKTTKG